MGSRDMDRRDLERMSDPYQPVKHRGGKRIEKGGRGEKEATMNFRLVFYLGKKPMGTDQGDSGGVQNQTRAGRNLGQGRCDGKQETASKTARKRDAASFSSRGGKSSKRWAIKFSAPYRNKKEER